MVAAAFVVKHLLWLEIAGFAVMLVGALWAVANYRRMAGVLGANRSRRGRSRHRERRAASRAEGTMMERLEARWRRRKELGR
jgi:hypothetical protein